MAQIARCVCVDCIQQHYVIGSVRQGYVRKYGKQYAIKYGFVVVGQPTGNFAQVKLFCEETTD